MKVFRIQVGIDAAYAHVHAQLGQNTSIGSRINVMWDSWLAKGNIIPDFLFSMYCICKKEIADDLTQKFNGLDDLELCWTKNPNELNAKNLDRLKWLPKGNIELRVILTRMAIPILPQSTVIYGKSGLTGNDCIKEIVGASQLRGNVITPRDMEKGIFFSEKEVGDYDFFKPTTTSFLLCTEKVKRYIESKHYSNVFFLEVGDII